MLCPRCGTNQIDEVKFCKVCGANLQAVRDVLENREPEKKFDWSDTWLAEMFKSGRSVELRRLEMDRQMGLTPAVKRYNEIKAGVITSAVGVGVAIFLSIFMQGLLGSVSANTAEILTRIWVAGVIPFFVGIALIINGLVVSKRMVEIQEDELKKRNALDAEPGSARSLRPADTNEFIPAGYSVTEQTTRHLAGSEQKSEN